MNDLHCSDDTTLLTLSAFGKSLEPVKDYYAVGIYCLGKYAVSYLIYFMWIGFFGMEMLPPND